MRLQPIVYTRDMRRAVAWYGKMLGMEPGYSSDMWTAFEVGGATLGIHRVEARAEQSNVELSLIAGASLEDELARLESAGVTIERGIEEEAFGRSILLRDPDGSPVQVNERHH